jgi:YgiT-type zinc finger domain-containing protein
MKCGVCGATMARTVSDLPFKTTDRTIIILKDVPVFQCGNCGQYLLDDAVMSRVDEILSGDTGVAELEVIRYAA